MTEEQARTNAKALALGMGITFYVVRSREGRILLVQLPSDDCEVLASIAPPRGVHDTRVGVNLDTAAIRGERISRYGISGNSALGLCELLARRNVAHLASG